MALLETFPRVPGACTCLGLGLRVGRRLWRWFSPLPGLEASFRNCGIQEVDLSSPGSPPEESVLSCPSPVLFVPDEGSGRASSLCTFLSPGCSAQPFLRKGSVLAGHGVRAGIFCLLRLLLFALPQV